ncbi:MAG: hypothetical protein GX149_00830, partial [Acholeplasmataceae bacterium]|nr:hypothetical protein [Acholeplasmataceae bacterium]
GEFRGRGHGSWENFLKKGYKVKFDKKQGLFGLAANKHWALVAGGHDDSLIRHNLAYTIAGESLDYINFQTAVTELEVYINGSYHGVYSLFEQIRVAEGRVDIDSQFGEVETDYLLEYDAYAVDEGEEGLVYFRVPGLKYPFLIKGPKMTDYEEKGFSEAEIRPQVEYIKGYVTEVVEAIFNEDEAEFRRLADVNSFVDMYILHELFKNTDTGWSSFYLYKQVGDKLYAGPAWDFDLSSGVNRGDQGPTGFYVSDKVQQYSAFTASEIYISLMQQEWFKIEFANRFLEVKANITSSINDYYLKISDYEDAYKRDAVRWTNGNNLWETEQQNLKVWLLTRIDWLSDWCEDYLAN